MGRMAAEYLRRARKTAGLPDIELRSIWAWDDGTEQPGLPHEAPGLSADRENRQPNADMV